MDGGSEAKVEAAGPASGPDPALLATAPVRRARWDEAEPPAAGKGGSAKNPPGKDAPAPGRAGTGGAVGDGAVDGRTAEAAAPDGARSTAEASPEVGGQRVVVTRPRPRRTGGLGGLFARLSHRMSMPRIRLDAFGSFAWRHLDGGTTVGQVAEAMRREFGEAAEPAEERAARFVAQLHELELVLLPGFDPPEEVTEARQRESEALR